MPLLVSSTPPGIETRLRLDAKSVASCHLRLYGFAKEMGSGTGFIVRHAGVYFLVTNYHVVSGINTDTREQLDHTRPDRVLIPIASLHPGGLHWRPIVQSLIDRGAWVEHPTWGSKFDVVALPLELDSRTHPIVYEFEPGPDLAITPGSDVMIIGFPTGVGGPGVTAIWKQGAVASEADWPFPSGDLADTFFYIDSNTRKGMSGSPVVARRVGASLMNDGATEVGPGIQDRVLGVYSGRAMEAPDMTIGKVWKWRGVQELLDHAVFQVFAGKSRAHPTTIGILLEATNQTGAMEMELDLEKTCDFVLKHPATGQLEAKQLSVGEFMLDFVLNDVRFGANLDLVRMGARIAAQCTKDSDSYNGKLKLTSEEYAVVREAIQQPHNAYAPAVARQILPLLEYIMNPNG